MARERLRVALIGCGVISNNHILPLLATPECELVAICDIELSRAESKRELYAKGARVFSDYREMLRQMRPDAVHIATPHYLHAEMAIAALEGGAHVFLEKPIATTRADAKRLIEVAKKTGKLLTVCFQNRFTPYVAALGEFLRKYPPEAAYATVIWGRGEDYYKADPWRGKWATEGGGVMINQAIHTLDLLCFFLGKPKNISATIANHHLKGVIEVEDSCEGTVEFVSGVRASFFATTAFCGPEQTELFFACGEHTLRLIGEKLFFDDKPIPIENATTPDGKICYGTGHQVLIRRFYDAILEGKESPIAPESAYLPLSLLLGAYESHGERISLNT